MQRVPARKIAKPAKRASGQTAKDNPNADAKVSINASETAEPDAQAGEHRRRIHGEHLVLRGVQYLLLIGAAAFLAVDFKRIYERNTAPMPGQLQTEPVIMRPPKPSDHVRPYLPRSAPIRQSRVRPRMPGYAKPPAHAALAQPMTFRRGPRGAVSAVGRIEPGTAAKFRSFLDGQGGEVRSLYLHSPGGSVRDALAVSKLIRKSAIATHVPSHAYCASSCPIVLAGGTRRKSGSDAWIGVHQIYAAGANRDAGTLEQGMARAQEISAEVQDHLVKMGVDAKVWIHAMRTPSHALYVFTQDQLATYKLAGSRGL